MSIDLELYGIISAEKITHLISDADIYLFIRGGISSQRTTAIAGIACGRPIVAYAGSHTGYPLTEAGLVTVPDGDCEALAQAMIRILTDEELWEELHQRSISAYQKYFSWNCIAEQYLRCFDKTSSKRSRSLTEDSNAENKPE
jgi:glycosyltransferase involved in cell wall biosynthesis